MADCVFVHCEGAVETAANDDPECRREIQLRDCGGDAGDARENARLGFVVRGNGFVLRTVVCCGVLENEGGSIRGEKKRDQEGREDSSLVGEEGRTDWKLGWILGRTTGLAESL